MIRRRPNSPLSKHRQGGATGATSRSRPAATVVNYGSDDHVLVDSAENGQLYQYETSVKKSFDAIVPTLKKV